MWLNTMGALHFRQHSDNFFCKCTAKKKKCFVIVRTHCPTRCPLIHAKQQYLNTSKFVLATALCILNQQPHWNSSLDGSEIFISTVKHMEQVVPVTNTVSRNTAVPVHTMVAHRASRNTAVAVHTMVAHRVSRNTAVPVHTMMAHTVSRNTDVPVHTMVAHRVSRHTAVPVYTMVEQSEQKYGCPLQAMGAHRVSRNTAALCRPWGHTEWAEIQLSLYTPWWYTE